MSRLPETIRKHPELKPAEDYYRLRREGVGFIAQMGSRLWTDYNTHDPGITILEALCYAITDLAYRTGWDIKDILTPPPSPSDQSKPYSDQPFFGAKEILTVNPTTPDDFRRLLIDLETVCNAWLFCKECACDPSYYAWCDKDKLVLSYQPSADVTPAPQPVSPRGLYDALLELEVVPELGDLNDHKIELGVLINDSEGDHPITMELRFPGACLANNENWALFLNDEKVVKNSGGNSFSVKLKRLGATKTFDVFTDPSLKDDADAQNDYIRRHWRNVFYLDFEIKFTHSPSDKPPKVMTFDIKNVAMRVFSNASAKRAVTAYFFEELFNVRKVGSTVVRHYRNKAKATREAVASAKEALHAHRNLDEDYCRINVVGVEEVAVCADVEVKPDADIELVQARIWFEIERYLTPPVPFYSLQELLDAGEAVEEIYNGPALKNGFIKAKDLEAASLKSVLRVSDIINRLMDIDGVIAVNQLQLVKYDAEGNVIRGAADPNWDNNEREEFTFDTNKSSASWLLYISKQHQPRLYLNASRFLFYKNGLPFRPRMDEARDTLTQLRGEAERPKIRNASMDLTVPVGKYRNPDDYYPVQYSFPLTYGIGPEGLPANASDKRRAQAKQLKAYLMVFEQILGNAFAQITHAADLFSLNPEVKRTYFVKEFSEALIQGYDEIVKGLGKPALEAMTETSPEFHERRNRFLDHIMARFGEQFAEYALLLTNLQGQQVALDQLIEDKISFLNNYPLISRDRAKAFDYSQKLCQPKNVAILKKRISLLLGFPDMEIKWTHIDLGLDKFRVKFELFKFELSDKNKANFRGYITRNAHSKAEAEASGYRAILDRMSIAENYNIAEKEKEFILRLTRKKGYPHGRFREPFGTRVEAEAARDELLAWSSSQRMIIVEHLLLRPKFPGDALYPACPDGACATCGDEDPYSFRLTFVMPGWMEPFKTNMEMRDFAERTIRQETPSHLIGKICWVSHDDFKRFEDAWCNWLEANADRDWTEERLQERVEALLADSLAAKGDKETLQKDELCRCADIILTNYGTAFHDWMTAKLEEGKSLDDIKQLEDFEDFSPTAGHCPDFENITILLRGRYKEYVKVSYHLRTVVNLLGRLNNVYPPATLHDWDEGNDENPARLGKTALGS